MGKNASKNTAKYTLRMSEEQRQTLERCSEETHVSEPEIVRIALSDFFGRWKKGSVRLGIRHAA